MMCRRRSKLSKRVAQPPFELLAVVYFEVRDRGSDDLDSPALHVRVSVRSLRDDFARTPKINRNALHRR